MHSLSKGSTTAGGGRNLRREIFEEIDRDSKRNTRERVSVQDRRPSIPDLNEGMRPGQGKKKQNFLYNGEFDPGSG